ncbi:Tis11 [Symbiodinium natans]|uniref:Tis11 protein n=1 Tax=Symbiodinium natans TaxID=878477 RepID=A0A812NXW9_9DINO|nr:Tis11 [Symbiodinium natans]
MTKSEQKKAVQFTRMCKFWRTNECKMGADCTFAHASSELRPSPKPCFEFSKTGSCKRGRACRFVHSADGVKSRNAKDPPAQASSEACSTEPLIRPVGPSEVIQCTSASVTGGELFDMPRLGQLFPPRESDFMSGPSPQGLLQNLNSLGMRDIEAFAREARIARRSQNPTFSDLRQTAAEMRSSLSESPEVLAVEPRFPLPSPSLGSSQPSHLRHLPTDASRPSNRKSFWL